tara:strand:+ start:1007 stop:1123 length:117 start_codon:yes stop_codon:yes gene_type:complete
MYSPPLTVFVVVVLGGGGVEEYVAPEISRVPALLFVFD